MLVMSPSKSTNDRSCDGSQDRKVDRLDIKTTFPRWVWAIPFLFAFGSMPTRSTWLRQSSPEGQVAGQAGWDHSCQGAWWSHKLPFGEWWSTKIIPKTILVQFGKATSYLQRGWVGQLVPLQIGSGQAGEGAGGEVHASYDHGLFGNLGVCISFDMCLWEHILVFKDQKHLSVSQE